MKFLIIAILLSPFQSSVVFVLVQVEKDIRHPLLLEQPSLQAAISSWHTDFELQQIFRKGKTQQFSISYYVLFYITPVVFCQGCNRLQNGLFGLYHIFRVTVQITFPIGKNEKKG